LGLFFAGLLLRWGPLFTFLWLGLSLLIFIAYAIAGRLGYKRFVAAPAMALDEDFAVPKDEHRVPLRATGIFSVQDYEGYVLEHPAEYWRVPLGQHVFMVQQQPGRFLYQIVEPDHIKAIEPGYLLFGKKPQKALALHFLVSWGPDFVDEPRLRYVATDEPQGRAPTEERTIYFTFDHEADRHAVWKSLLRSAEA
jgi:hypothetical protein